MRRKRIFHLLKVWIKKRAVRMMIMMSIMIDRRIDKNKKQFKIKIIKSQTLIQSLTLIRESLPDKFLSKISKIKIMIYMKNIVTDNYKTYKAGRTEQN